MYNGFMKKHLSVLLLCLGILFGVVSFLGWFWFFRDLPPVPNLENSPVIPSIRVVDRHGKLLYEIMDEQGGRHAVIPIEQIPEALIKATLATEDRNFYKHPGFDLVGVARAILINLRGGETIAGGSTITQQVVRNLMMTAQEKAERSIHRKAKEIILAWQIEQRYEKDEILALYLNQTYYGGLAYGVEAAAQTFFGKPVTDLDLAEAALIAGLPQSPAVYNPYTSFEDAKSRQRTVLNLMEQAGWITAEENRLAYREPLVLAETPYPVEAPHFVMMVRSDLDRIFSSEELLNQGGLVVETTLDLDWQRLAQQAVERQIKNLAKSNDGLGHNVNSAALVALIPQTGEILGLVGSPDFFDKNQAGAINMAISPRQPGSALKPIVYAAALDPANPTGGWTAATMLLDVTTAFQTHDEKPYIPANYDLKEHGPVLLRQALASSLNIPAVLTLDHIGLETLAEYATKFGISTLDDPHTYDLSLALGGGAVRLLDLSAAYGTFANGGYRVKPKTILQVRNAKGESLYISPEMERIRILDERVAWLISDILSDMQARRLGFGPNTVLQIDRPAAVKTGTTSNFHDNWTVGYTPELVVGVWAGNTDYAPMHEVDGLTGAAPIWHDFIRLALSGAPITKFARPEGITRVEICSLSGLLPSQVCPYTKSEWFLDGTQPVQKDTFYRSVVVDVRTGLQAENDTPLDQRQEILALDLPPQAWAWAHTNNLKSYNDLINKNFDQSNFATSQDTINLMIASPPDGSQYFLSTFTDPDSQRILIQVVAPSNVSTIRIFIDNHLIEVLTSPPYQTWWRLQTGVHQIKAEGITLDGKLFTSNLVEFTVNPAPPP